MQWDSVLSTKMNVKQNQGSIYSHQIEGFHRLRGLSAAQPELMEISNEGEPKVHSDSHQWAYRLKRELFCPNLPEPYSLQAWKWRIINCVSQINERRALTLQRISRRWPGFLPIAMVLFGERTKTDGICLPGLPMVNSETLTRIKISTVIPPINRTLSGIRTSRLQYQNRYCLSWSHLHWSPKRYIFLSLPGGP